MAREGDKKDDKRGRPAAKKADEPRKKPPRAKAAPDAKPAAAPRKKAVAAPPARKPAKAAAAPGARRAPAAGKPAKNAAAKVAAKRATPEKPAAPRKRAAGRKPLSKGAPPAPPVLDEEERIEDAKYQPRHQARRLFEEERFIFPDSYGQSRIRLLVKDPEWLFAHWDVDPQSLADLRAELGERASALSSFTLRVSDPEHGGESRVLLPDGARSWYVRADSVQRSYQAELGLTLPSGEFRPLARSNVVTTPRTGPARTGGPRRMRYDGAAPSGHPSASPAPPAASPAGQAPADPGPWHPDPSTTSYPGPGGEAGKPGEARGTGRPGEPSGGASDVYRR